MQDNSTARSTTFKHTVRHVLGRVWRRIGERRTLGRAAVVSAMALSAAGLQAQTWPSQPIRLVVPYSAGGQFDVTARILATEMGKLLGTTVLVENRAGGSTIVGTDLVAKAKNDGYTLLFAGSNTFAILPTVYKSLPFKTSDFQSLSMVIEFPVGMFANVDLPVKDMKELAAYAKNDKVQLSSGNSGQAGMQHLVCEMAKDAGGFTTTSVPYRGSPEIIQDLMPGRLSIACDALAAYVPHVRSGKLKALGVSSSKRVESLPGVPTFAEQGYPSLAVSSWAALFAPAGVDPQIVRKLNATIVEAMKQPVVADKIRQYQGTPMATTPEELDRIIAHDTAALRPVLQKLGLEKSQ